MKTAPMVARWDYHATHINQLLQLHTIASNYSIFKETAERWTVTESPRKKELKTKEDKINERQIKYRPSKDLDLIKFWGLTIALTKLRTHLLLKMHLFMV